MQLFWFIYLYRISSTCFGRCFRPSSGALDCIYSLWYSPPIMQPAASRLHYRWTISEAVNTVKCSWWGAKTSPETCRTDSVQINKPRSCILLVINYELSISDTWAQIWWQFKIGFNYTSYTSFSGLIWLRIMASVVLSIFNCKYYDTIISRMCCCSVDIGWLVKEEEKRIWEKLVAK